MVTVVPTIYIDVDDGADVVEKSYYDATIRIDGKAKYDNIEGVKARIKGRGNSTWKNEKRPYKIKLDQKRSILGYSAAKEWVLLANYIDPSLMINSAIMKVGELLGARFVNRVIPVDLYLNGKYNGSYALTEQIEVKESRVDIKSGYLLEIDSYYDEEYQYRSPILNLAVMLKDGAYVQSDSVVLETLVKVDFNRLEAALMDEEFPNNGYEELVDLESVAIMFLANEIAINRDFPRLKSLYLYKEEDEKFMFGPLWDFDWCCGYKKTSCLDHFDPEIYQESLINRYLAHNTRIDRQDFLSNFFLDPQFVTIYKRVWRRFYRRKSQFYDYLDCYAATLKSSADANFELWDSPYGRDFDQEYERMRVWFEKRIEHLNIAIMEL